MLCLERNNSVLRVIQQVLTALPGAFQALFLSPTGDITVVSAEEDVGDGHPAVFPRACVLGVFEQSLLRKGVVFVARLVTQNAWNEPDDGVNQHHCGNFAAVADEVPSRDLKRLKSFGNALVKALISATQQQQTVR